MTAAVIIPTTGKPSSIRAIKSVLSQDYPTACYLVNDGDEHWEKTEKNVREITAQGFVKFDNLHVSYLPVNVGANGFYGHRIYAAFSHLVKEDFVLFLDEDNWFDEDHISECIKTLTTKKVDWVYSLRKIVNSDGEFLCYDNCESLGKWKAWTDVHHIDTSCYCIKRDVIINVSSAWHGGWGQDRVFYNILQQYRPEYACTGAYTVNYRLDGNPGSVNYEFFEKGNIQSSNRYNVFDKNAFPWQNR